MSTTTCTAVVLAEEPAERTEAIAVGGFLAGYAGATRTSYATDLRIFATWCRQADLSLLTVRRSHLEPRRRLRRNSGAMETPARENQECCTRHPTNSGPWSITPREVRTDQ